MPPPPEVPALGALFVQLEQTDPQLGILLERKTAVWRQEVGWLHAEPRSTSGARERARSVVLIY